MKIRTGLFVTLGVLALTDLRRAPAQLPDAAALRHVKAIYVGAMGLGNEAEHYRLLLKDELGRVGFDVSDKAVDADAVLTGTISAEVHGDRALARATVTLKTRAGRQIWSGDYVSQHWGQGANDTVRGTARDCAVGLRKDREKAAAASK